MAILKIVDSIVSAIKSRTTDFWAGMALSTPFVAAMLPSKILYLSILLIVPFVVHTSARKLTVISVPKLLAIPLLLAPLHLVLLSLSNTKFGYFVTRDAIITLVIILFSAVGRLSNADGTQALSGFRWGLVPVCLPLALLSITKFIGNEYGIHLSFLGDPYPPHGSLKLDYNIFGLSALTCGILTMAQAVKMNRKSRWVMILASALFALSATTSGSRRILILMPLCLAAFLFTLMKARQLSIRSILVAVFSLTAIIYILGWLNLLGPITGLISTINPETMLGLLARTERWNFALNLLTSSNYWRSAGFAYHEAFSCKFSSCLTFDYPHSPILSEWIILGVGGGLIVIVFYLQLGTILLRSNKSVYLAGLPFIGLAAMVTSLISGDTLLSHPQLLAFVAIYTYFYKHNRCFTFTRPKTNSRLD